MLQGGLSLKLELRGVLKAAMEVENALLTILFNAGTVKRRGGVENEIDRNCLRGNLQPRDVARMVGSILSCAPCQVTSSRRCGLLVQSPY